MGEIIWDMTDGDSFTTLEILEGRDLNREHEEHAAMIDARIVALEANASVAAHCAHSPAPTQRQQVAEAFLDAAVGEWGYRATADWLYKAAMRVFYRDPDAHDRLVAMGRLLEQAAREEQDA